jgi:hypothetical protein
VKRGAMSSPTPMLNFNLKNNKKTWVKFVKVWDNYR